MTYLTNKGFEDLLIDDFTVLRETYINDEIGGRSVRYKVVDSDKGRLSTTSGKGTEVDKGGKDVAEVSYTLFCLTNVEVQKNDIIKIDDKNLRVISVKEPSNMGHHLEVDLEELQPDVKTRIFSIISEKERVTAELNIK